ncbi:MAG: hypothetical protein ACR2JU_04800, partial [Nocardioidaceae bacterium]
ITSGPGLPVCCLVGFGSAAGDAVFDTLDAVAQTLLSTCQPRCGTQRQLVSLGSPGRVYRVCDVRGGPHNFLRFRAPWSDSVT